MTWALACLLWAGFAVCVWWLQRRRPRRVDPAYIERLEIELGIIEAPKVQPGAVIRYRGRPPTHEPTMGPLSAVTRAMTDADWEAAEREKLRSFIQIKATARRYKRPQTPRHADAILKGLAEEEVIDRQMRRISGS